MQRMKMMIEIPVVVRHDVDADGWIAGSLQLGVFAGGPTPDDAVSAVTEALQLFCETCLEQDILDNTLRERGFVLLSHNDAILPSDPPRLSTDELIRQVPVELLFGARTPQGDGACHH